MIINYTLSVTYKDKRQSFSETATVISTGRASDSDAIFTEEGRVAESYKLAMEDVDSKLRSRYDFEPATKEDIELMDMHTTL